MGWGASISGLSWTALPWPPPFLDLSSHSPSAFLPLGQRNMNSCLREAPLGRKTIKWELTCDGRLSSLLLACQVPGSLWRGQWLTGRHECLRLWGTVCGLLFYGGNSGRTKEVSSEAAFRSVLPSGARTTSPALSSSVLRPEFLQSPLGQEDR